MSVVVTLWLSAGGRVLTFLVLTGHAGVKTEKGKLVERQCGWAEPRFSVVRVGGQATGCYHMGLGGNWPSQVGPHLGRSRPARSRSRRRARAAQALSAGRKGRLRGKVNVVLQVPGGTNYPLRSWAGWRAILGAKFDENAKV